MALLGEVRNFYENTHVCGFAVLIRRASAQDFDKAYAILVKISAWLRTKGINQWQEPYPADFFRRSIDAGEIFVAVVEGKIIATVTLTRAKDAYWGEADPEALYLHRIAVLRERANKNIGVALIKWCEEETARRGIPLLRLDCLADNPVMRAYYASLGFMEQGLGVGDSRFALFEKQIPSSNSIR